MSCSLPAYPTCVICHTWHTHEHVCTYYIWHIYVTYMCHTCHAFLSQPVTYSPQILHFQAKCIENWSSKVVLELLMTIRATFKMWHMQEYIWSSDAELRRKFENHIEIYNTSRSPTAYRLLINDRIWNSIRFSLRKTDCRDNGTIVDL